MSLQYYGKTLDTQEMKTCCKELDDNTLTALTLRDCGFGTRSFRRLMTSIGHCESLEYLNLNLCNINCSERINMLAAAVNSNRRLYALHLHGNEMGHEGVSKILTALKDHPRIMSLDLGGTKMDDSNLKQICDLLPPRDNHPGLCELILSANPKITNRAWEKFAVAVSASSNLTHLQLDFNEIGETAGKMLLTAIAGHRALEILDLEACGLTESVGRLFLYMVQHFPCSLTKVLLEGNNFEQRTLLCIRMSLGESQSEGSSSDEEERPRRDPKTRVAKKTRSERDATRRRSATSVRSTAQKQDRSGPSRLPGDSQRPTTCPDPYVDSTGRRSGQRPQTERLDAPAALVYPAEPSGANDGARSRTADPMGNGKKAQTTDASHKDSPAAVETGSSDRRFMTQRTAIQPTTIARPVTEGNGTQDAWHRTVDKSHLAVEGGESLDLGGSAMPIERQRDNDYTCGYPPTTPALQSRAAQLPSAKSHASSTNRVPCSASRKYKQSEMISSDIKSAEAPSGGHEWRHRATGEKTDGDGCTTYVSMNSQEQRSYRMTAGNDNVDVTYTFTPESPDADCSLKQCVEEDSSGISRLRIMGECGGGRVQVRMRSVSPDSLGDVLRSAAAPQVGDRSETPSSPVQPIRSSHAREREVFSSEKKAHLHSFRGDTGPPRRRYRSSDSHTDSDDESWPPKCHSSRYRDKRSQHCVSHRGRWIERSPQRSHAPLRRSDFDKPKEKQPHEERPLDLERYGFDASKIGARSSAAAAETASEKKKPDVNKSAGGVGRVGGVGSSESKKGNGFDGSDRPQADGSDSAEVQSKFAEADKRSTKEGPEDKAKSPDRKSGTDGKCADRAEQKSVKGVASDEDEKGAKSSKAHPRSEGKDRKSEPHKSRSRSRGNGAGGDKPSAAGTAERNPERRGFLDSLKFCSSNGATATSESIRESRKSHKVRIESSGKDDRQRSSGKPKSRSTRAEASADEKKKSRSSRSKDRSRSRPLGS